MPKLQKGSQEAKDYMKMIREKKTSNSNISYETFKGKKSKKNITMDLERDIETLPSGEQIIKTIKKKKVNGEPVEENIDKVIVPINQEQNQEIKKKGRPSIYKTPEEAKIAKRKQTIASNKKKYAERKLKNKPTTNIEEIKQVEKENLEGGSINISKPFNKIGNKITDTTENITNYGKAIIYGRNDYPPKVRNILKKVGHKYVKSITIKRTPVSGLLTGALSIFSLGEFGKRMEKSFDELFHLFIELVLEDDTKVSLEKNEVINMDINPKNRDNTESKTVTTQIPHNTIDIMLDNCNKYMGAKRFFGYSAKDNNCQDFIIGFFKSNNIGNDEDFIFIKQDTKKLFKNLPYLRKLANTVTDIGATANVITTGAGIDEIKTYSEMLNHLTHHITDPNEPIDPMDYKQSIELIKKIREQKKDIKGKGLKDKSYIVQSVVFDKDKFNITSAKKWLKENKFKYPKVDKQENTIRFRQESPEKVENEGFTEYRTKNLNNSGIKLIIAYKKNKISNNNINMEGGKIIVHHIHHIHHSKNGKGIKYDSDSNSDSDSDSSFEGGKINLGDVNKALNTTEKISKKVGKYITKKKGGLATDLIDYGIPATTAAVLGGIGSATGIPALGVLGSAAGSKIGNEYIAPAVHKASGAGLKKGRFVKGSKEAKEHMSKIRNMKKN